MNEYVVGINVGKSGKVVAELLVEAENKDDAIAKAIKQCEDDELNPCGVSFCDWCG